MHTCTNTNTRTCIHVHTYIRTERDTTGTQPSHLSDFCVSFESMCTYVDVIARACVILYLHTSTLYSYAWSWNGWLISEENDFSKSESLAGIWQFVVVFLHCQPRNFEIVTLVTRRREHFRGFGRYFGCWTPSEKRCLSIQEFPRFLSKVSSQRLAMRIDTSLVIIELWFAC